MKYIALHHLAPVVAVMMFAVFAIVWLMPVLSIGLQSNTTPTPTPTPTVDTVTFEGQVVCLPHKDQSGPQTLECAYGLKANSGEYYGLQNLDQEQLINATITTGKRYQITGTSSPPEATSRYAIVSTISVTEISAL